MKKAKFMLSAIAVLGLVGGALAFKAQKGNAVLYYDPTGIGTNCSATLSPVISLEGTTTTFGTFDPAQTATCTTVNYVPGE